MIRLRIVFLMLCSLMTTHSLCTDPDNGIGVGKVQYYDARSFTLMLKQSEQALADFNFLKGETLAAAIGKLQGGRIQSSELAVKASTLPVPSFQRVQTSTTDATGVTEPETDTTTTIQRDAQSPHIPDFSGFSPSFTTPTGFSYSARDLLSEQLELNHQVVNLRMLREAALSDRFLENDRESGARAQVLLGFPITLSPTRPNAKAVAEVKVTLKLASKDMESDSQNQESDSQNQKSDSQNQESDSQNQESGSQNQESDSQDKKSNSQQRQGPNLITLLPAKNTYNVAALTNKQSSVGLGAIVNVINLGFANSKKKETYYLVKDTDTFAIRHNNDPKNNSLSFGWQFRPVLGRKTVDPGPRQVFAMISLPRFAKEDFELEVEVDTYWRKLANNKVPKKKRVNKKKHASQTLKIVGVHTLNTKLAPETTSVHWYRVDNGNVLVTLTGTKYFNGTNIFAAGKHYRQGDGLILEGESRISFTVPHTNIADTTDFKIAGPFGKSIPILNPSGNEQLEFDASIIQTSNPERFHLELDITGGLLNSKRGGQQLSSPILSVNGTLYWRDKFRTEETTLNDSIKIDKIILPLRYDQLREQNSIQLHMPFHNRQIKHQMVEFKGLFLSSVILIREGATPIIGIRGSGFQHKALQVILGDQVFDTDCANAAADRTITCAPNLITLETTAAALKNVKHLIVKREGYLSVLPLDFKTKPPPEPELALTSIEAIAKGEARKLAVIGVNLQIVKEVNHGGNKLEFESDPSGARGKVFVSIKLTETAGKKTLTFVTMGGKKKDIDLLVEQYASGQIIAGAEEK